jgi:hypothetical protein
MLIPHLSKVVRVCARVCVCVWCFYDWSSYISLSLICKRLFNLFWCNFTRLLISSDQIFDVFDRLVEKDIVTSLEIAPRLLGSLWDDRRSSVRHHGPDPHVERQRALERERLCQRLAHRFLSGIVQSPPSFPSLRSVSLSSLEFANYMPDLSPLATLQHLNHLSLSVENANNTVRKLLCVLAGATNSHERNKKEPQPIHSNDSFCLIMFFISVIGSHFFINSTTIGVL